MSILFLKKIVDFIGANWKFFAAGVVLMIAFGWGYKVRGDKCDKDMRVAVEMFQAQANEMGTRFEQEVLSLKEKRVSQQERIYETSKPDYNCIIPATGVQQYVSAIKAGSR